MKVRRAAIALFCCVTLLGCASGAKKVYPVKAQVRFAMDMAKRGLWNESLFRFGQIARVEPDNPEAQNNLAVAYEAAGMYEDALRAYQNALRADEKSKKRSAKIKQNYSRFMEFYQSLGGKPSAPAAATASRSANGGTL